MNQLKSKYRAADEHEYFTNTQYTNKTDISSPKFILRAASIISHT